MNRYQLLFEQYVQELQVARSAVLLWWEGLLRANVEQAGSLLVAEENIRIRWPFGPTSHPHVIAVYRKYYLACEELNRRIDAEAALRSPLDPQESESDWGVEDKSSTSGEESGGEESGDEDWGEEEFIDPPTFLFEMLEGRNDELAEFMTYFVYPCIGEENGRAA